MKIMCVVNEMEALMEMKQLYDQEELNEDGANRWETLSRQVRGGYFVDDLLDLLDRDIELTSQLQRILITTGTNMQEIILGGVALGVYILERLYPNDHGCDVSCRHTFGGISVSARAVEASIISIGFYLGQSLHHASGESRTCHVAFP